MTRAFAPPPTPKKRAIVQPKKVGVDQEGNKKKSRDTLQCEITSALTIEKC